jgi:hypothetical protein
MWGNDCKKIGKDNLAVSLQERFLYWLLLCPLWLVGLVGNQKYEAAGVSKSDFIEQICAPAEEEANF